MNTLMNVAERMSHFNTRAPWTMNRAGINLSTVYALQFETINWHKEGSDWPIATWTKVGTCSIHTLMDTVDKISHLNTRAPRTQLECTCKPCTLHRFDSIKLNKEGSNGPFATETKVQTCSIHLLMDSVDRISHSKMRAPRTELDCTPKPCTLHGLIP